MEERALCGLTTPLCVLLGGVLFEQAVGLY
jgi:hypothetical protein